MNLNTFYLLGKDARYDLVEKELSFLGARIFRSFETEQKEKAFFFLPMGMKENEILSLMEEAKPESIFLMAKMSPKIKEKANEKNLFCSALFDFEPYHRKNSIATAEGALAEIIQKTDRALSELCILIYGYGHCGKEIANLLWLCGCEVWIWSRERGQKKALADGFNLFDAPKHGFSMFDCVVNTVPDPIFSDSLLATLQEKSHFFQIASGNSGISEDILSRRGVCFHPLPSLPGKVSPASEADLILQIIKHLLKEEKERSKK